MDNPFMARAIQLSIENVRSGKRGPLMHEAALEAFSAWAALPDKATD
jgi:hypothetical protein